MLSTVGEWAEGFSSHPRVSIRDAGIGGTGMMLLDLLMRARELEASDVHLCANSPPIYRIDGDLLLEGEPLPAEATAQMARELLSETQWIEFQQEGEVDFSHNAPGVSRYRMNVYKQRGAVSIAARVVPNSIPRLDELGLPDVVKELTLKPHGLVLVTGPTGSGKTTTLAAMVDYLNQSQRRHIITLEDPIEYWHENNRCVIDQREIGKDSRSFAKALRAALRQDPDVILVGEMRDLETISTAITAAETGHLVFATLHTSDSVQTIDRIIDIFPAAQQSQVRTQLAAVLKGVLSQRLVKTIQGNSRVAALEILLNVPAVANLIRSQKAHQIRSVMETARASGMQTMEMHLRQLASANRISGTAVRQWTTSQIL